MAEVYNLLCMAGQSNAQGQGAKGWPDVPRGQALEYNLSELIDFADTNDGMRSTIFPAFTNAMDKLDGGKWCVLKTAGGGTSLLPEPVLVNGDWSPSGTFRSYCVSEVNEAISAINSNPDYELGKVIVWWAQGEADGGYIELGTPNFSGENYKNALPVLVDYIKDNINAPLDGFYVSRLGTTVSGANESGFAEIRQAQEDACSLRSDMHCFYLRATDYPAYGWMVDEVHWGQLGLNDQGDKLSEYLQGESLPLYKDSPYTEVVNIPDLVGYWDGDGVSRLVDGQDFTIQGTAISEPSELMPDVPDYTQINTIDGDGWADLATTGLTHSVYTKTAYVYIETDFVLSESALWGDATENLKGSFFLASSELGVVGYNPSFNRVLGSPSVPVNGLKGSFVSLAEVCDGTNTKFYVNGVLANESAFAPDWTDSVFSLSRCTSIAANPVLSKPVASGARFSQPRIYNRALYTSEIEQLVAESTLFNSTNTPVTPDAPVITNEDNDTNLFEYTATGDTEMRISGGAWFDQDSPYDVGNINLPIGAIEVRVKEVGVNPASDIVASTIAYTFSNLLIQNDTGTTENANSYVDGEYYVAYMAKRGITIPFTTESEIATAEASLIQATAYIDTANKYCGEKLNGRDQTTAFPTSPLYDDSGYLVEGVPREIKEAQCEYANIYTEQGTLQPNQNVNGSVKRTKEKVDVIEEEVEYTGSGQTGSKISYPIADNKIPKAFICGGSDGYFVRA